MALPRIPPASAPPRACRPAPDPTRFRRASRSTPAASRPRTCRLHGVTRGHDLIARPVHHFVPGPRPARSVPPLFEICHLPPCPDAGGETRGRTLQSFPIRPSHTPAIARRARTTAESLKVLLEMAPASRLSTGRPRPPAAASRFDEFARPFVVGQPLAIRRERPWPHEGLRLA